MVCLVYMWLILTLFGPALAGALAAVRTCDRKTELMIEIYYAS